MDEIRQIDPSKIDLKLYRKQLSDCVVLTHDNKIYMQYRPDNWGMHSNVVTIFGGHIEEGESPAQAAVRELNEETGAIIKPDDLIFIGSIAEGCANHTEIVHIHFWHDKENTITGCYEAEPIAFDTVEECLAHPEIMEYARWALIECRAKGFI